jgi:hypothetical protein
MSNDIRSLIRAEMQAVFPSYITELAPFYRNARIPFRLAESSITQRIFGSW